MSPLASIVITSYNQSRFVVKAIASARTQTFTDYEIIVVDDASTDGTQAYLAAQNDLIVISNPANRGRCYSRNRGLETAHGKYVTFLDGDDLLLPGKLKLQVDSMERESVLGMVFGNLQLCDTDDVDLPMRFSDVIRPSPGPDILEPLAYANFIQTSAPLIRVKALKHVGGFEEAMCPAEDWHLWLRLASYYPVRYEPVLVGKYRVHSGNTSQQRLNRTYGNAMVRRWLIDSPLFTRLSPKTQYICCISAGISLAKINEITEARRVLTKARAVRPLHPASYITLLLTHLGSSGFSRLTDWGRLIRNRIWPTPMPFGN